MIRKSKKVTKKDAARKPRVVKKSDAVILRSANADMMPRLTPGVMRQVRKKAEAPEFPI